MVKIGLEIHVQLTTQTKLFCGCPNRFVRNPNTYVCETCLGFPGSKPRVNAEAINSAIAIGLALGCSFPHLTMFSRKSYFYPDMSKNFQITQYEIPIAKNGKLRIPGTDKTVKISRINLEEDPARISHVGTITESKYCLVDYNRSGTPLCEIVTDPDFQSPEEARLALQELSSMLEYLGVYDSTIEGSMRIDANISIGPSRVEIKNISGFKDVEKALSYEIIRQKDLVRRGLNVERETRAWDAASNVTRSLRLKEEEEEYGYITEPDLPSITLEKEKIESIKNKLPEFAAQKVKRYQEQFKLEKELALAITSEPDLAAAFEEAVKYVSPDTAAKFFAKTLKKSLNWENLRLKNTKLTPLNITKLIKLIERKEITERAAELMLREMIISPRPIDPEEYMRMKGMSRISDEKTLEPIMEQALAKNAQAVVDFRSGREEAFEFLVGQIMRLSQGRADPFVIREMLKRRLGAR